MFCFSILALETKCYMAGTVLDSSQAKITMYAFCGLITCPPCIVIYLMFLGVTLVIKK
jgi:hypothetical protein